MTTKRIHFLVDEETKEQLNFIPEGIRAEVYRSLLRLLIRTQMTNLNIYVAEDIIQDRLILARPDQLKDAHRKLLSD